MRSAGWSMAAAAPRTAFAARWRATASNGCTARWSRISWRCRSRVRGSSYASGTAGATRSTVRRCCRMGAGIAANGGKYPSRWKAFSAARSASRRPSVRAIPVAHASSSGLGV